MKKQTVFLCLLVLGALAAPPAFAGENGAKGDDTAAIRKELQELRELVNAQKRAHEAEIKGLKEKIAELEKPRSSGAAGKSNTAGNDELEAVMAEMREDAEARMAESGWWALGRSLQSFNPEISVVGDFVGHYDSREGGDLDDRWLFRELEFSISGSIDPYARADVCIGIHRAHEHDDHEHGECGRSPGHYAHTHGYELHLEEAYVTLLTLPWDLQAKVGKFRPKFGKVNTVHQHALPWVEYPLVIRNYFGPEAMAGQGVSVSWLVPNKWDKYLELTYENFTNDEPNMFAGNHADDFTHLVHLKTFHDLTRSSTLEVGFSAATAPNDGGHGGRRTWMEGVDVTYKWRHPKKGLYKAFTWQTEFMAAQKELACRRECSVGLFTAMEYQFARRWSAGGRYDFCQCPDDAGFHENAWSAYLTFLQSEFMFWRLGDQYSIRNYEVNGQDSDHQVFLQCVFGLGPHRPHEY